MKPIAIFYHTLFEIEGRFLPAAVDIVGGQMESLKASGLIEAANEFYVGMNSGEEGVAFSYLFPDKATVVYHGLQCRNELRTLLLLEQWLKTHPDWYVLYFHAKGSTHVEGSDYASFAGRWRRCMMKTCVTRWRECVSELASGFEAVGAHWLTGMCDGTQHYFAGTFWWATSNYLRTLPSMMERDRLKESGIDSIESRYESEVWIGNGPRLPKIKDMETTHGFSGCP